MEPWNPGPTEWCLACDDAQSAPGDFVCLRCQPVKNRKDARRRFRHRNMRQRIEVMQRQYDKDLGAFLCYFTGAQMLTDGSKHDPRFATWEHLDPKDGGEVVLACRLVNAMKGDLGERDFEVVVKALAARFAGESFPDGAWPRT